MKLNWVKIRTATPIAATNNQSDFIGAFFHRLTPLLTVYSFRADPRRGGRAVTGGAFPCVRYPASGTACEAGYLLDPSASVSF
jgi:hypothetical protein